jgi:hypothetical protein
MMLIMHRPYFVGKEVETEFKSSVMAKETCLGAARESILLVHKVFFDYLLPVSSKVDEWSCYYHRLIAATMVLLIIAFDSAPTERKNLLGLTAKSLDVVRLMHSGAPCEAIPMIESAITTLTAME